MPRRTAHEVRELDLQILQVYETDEPRAQAAERLGVHPRYFLKRAAKLGLGSNPAPNKIDETDYPIICELYYQHGLSEDEIAEKYEVAPAIIERVLLRSLN